jgi:2-polyprenyl-3-methyl-5-hydroxy-6-metoxy-1,4-benzoquinol methylase
VFDLSTLQFETGEIYHISQGRYMGMIKKSIRKLLYWFGYEVQKISKYSADHLAGKKRPVPFATPPPLGPVWPLPQQTRGLTDNEIRKEFAKFDLWHYTYAFEGGISFPVRHIKPDRLIDDPKRHAQRFRHFMPWLLDAQNGSFKGKRVLDIACNSGYWSIQCALLGAEVVGFDARPELIRQADLIKSIVGLTNVKFTVLDIKEMNPRSLNGTFDVVLNMGFLFHVSNPLETLQVSKAMSHKHLLLDTAVSTSKNPVFELRWEEPQDTWTACRAGIVAYPSRRAVEMMLMHCQVTDWLEIPVRSREIPPDYLNHRHASWLITV